MRLAASVLFVFLSLAIAGAQASQALPSSRTIAYGSHTLQTIDVTMAPDASDEPVLLFVHGGGWRAGDKRNGARSKQAWALGNGWSFATTNYRLVPDASVEMQARDVAAAISAVVRDGGVAPSRIILAGHSAGAHLAALVASDPSYLSAHGLRPSLLGGIVLLDGAAYDVTARTRVTARGNRLIEEVFGRDPQRQRKLSPARQDGSDVAPRWLILPLADRAVSRAQAEALAHMLTGAGAVVSMSPIEGESHRSLNRSLGSPGNPATPAVEAFVAGAVP